MHDATSRDTRSTFDTGPPRQSEDGQSERAANPVWRRLATRPTVATGVGTRLQRQSDPSASADSPARMPTPYGVIVEDDAAVGEGQITRAEFLERLRIDIEARADEKLTAVGLTAKACPYIPFWLGYYARQSPAHIERAIARYGRPSDISQTGLRNAVVLRVLEGVDVWIASGFTEVASPFALGAVGDDVSGPETAPPELAAKLADGSHGPVSAGDPSAIQARLGEGQSLPGSVRTQMERGFGQNFGDVRLHQDRTAARLASNFSAHAFTVGSDIAFASGQYRPGTLHGDLLIAHELAHVVQQRGGGRADGSSASTAFLEENADQAALAAIGRTSSELGIDADAFALPLPSRAGLRLQRCSKGCGTSSTATEAPAIAPGLLENAALDKMSDEQLVDRFDQLISAERSVRAWGAKESSSEMDAQIKILVDQAELLAQEFARRHRPQRGESKRTFSPTAAARMRDFFKANAIAPKPLACINTLRKGMTQLYGDGASPAVASGLLITENNTIEETMEQMDDNQLVESKQIVYFVDNKGKKISNNSDARPEHVMESVWGKIVAMIGSDSSFSVFGMSLLDGYHSITITVDSRVPGRPRVYWSDQTSHHNEGWEEFQKENSGHAAGFQIGSPRGLDEYIERFVQVNWDAVKEKKHVAYFPVVRLWRIKQPPSKPASTPRGSSH